MLRELIKRPVSGLPGTIVERFAWCNVRPTHACPASAFYLVALLRSPGKVVIARFRASGLRVLPSRADRGEGFAGARDEPEVVAASIRGHAGLEAGDDSLCGTARRSEPLSLQWR